MSPATPTRGTGAWGAEPQPHNRTASAAAGRAVPQGRGSLGSIILSYVRAEVSLRYLRGAPSDRVAWPSSSAPAAPVDERAVHATGVVDRPVELVVIAERLFDPLGLEVRLAAVQRVDRVLRCVELGHERCEVVRRATRAAVEPVADRAYAEAGVGLGVRRGDHARPVEVVGDRIQDARAVAQQHDVM